MSQTDMWKYLSDEELKEFIISFRLLDQLNLTKEKELPCLYGISNHVEKHYRTLILKKQDGSVRRLLAPDFLLKMIQKNILHHILAALPISSYATAYHRGGGIAPNANPHIAKQKLLKHDITDFFGSILFPVVYQRVFKPCYFPPAAAGLLTHLCCCRDFLPQGAPASPAISNLVMKPFDDYMGKWCVGQGIIYTRYCDDMTFSGDFDPKAVKNKTAGFLKSMGLELNHKKTRILTPAQRQSVTGIVVNKKPQVSREFRRKLRQELYYCRKYGVKSHLEYKKAGRLLSMEDEGCRRYLLSLLGKINFILNVNPYDNYFTKEKGYVKELLLIYYSSF